MNKTIDGKKVIIKGNPKNIPPIKIIKNVYGKIPDDKKIPIVFQTKTQYLDEYIKNQEKVRGKPFPKPEIKRYKSTELANMANIVSRYTTKKNPYIDVRTVFFTDRKITPKQFEKSAYHEYGHEAWENIPSLRKDWRSVNQGNAPTNYGTTSRQEDLAESYMLYKTGQLRDPRRGTILADNISASRKSYDKVLPSVRKIMMAGGGAPEHYKTYEEGMKEAGLDLSEFDMNKDGEVNDKDIEIMKKKGIIPDNKSKGRITGNIEPQVIKHIPTPSIGGWRGDIEKQTIKNPNFRKVIFTGRNAQLVFMSLKPKQSIGNEVHPKVDQFFRIEQGKALFSLENGKIKYRAGGTGSVFVPAGTWHDVKNVTNKPLKLYTIYSPPQHPIGTIQRDKPSKDRIIRDYGSNNSIADALGWSLPEGVLESASWKLYGAPKKYDPRVMERGDLKGNIWKLTKEHYATMARSPLLNQQLLVDQVSQDWNLIKAAKSAYKGRGREKINLAPAPVSAGLKWTKTQYKTARKVLKPVFAPKQIDPNAPLPGPKWLQKIAYPMTTAYREGILEPTTSYTAIDQTSEYVPEIGYTPTDEQLLHISQQSYKSTVPRLTSGIYEKKPWILQ